VDDEPEHLDDDCWCKPYLIYTTANGIELYAHRSDDGTKPPPDVIADAIIELAFMDDDEPTP
jgi:hypothetical protein